MRAFEPACQDLDILFVFLTAGTKYLTRCWFNNLKNSRKSCGIGVIGRLLIRHILRFATSHYFHLYLRTDTEAAEQFYLAMGFSRVAQGDGSTHAIELKPFVS